MKNSDLTFNESVEKSPTAVLDLIVNLEIFDNPDFSFATVDILTNPEDK